MPFGVPRGLYLRASHCGVTLSSVSTGTPGSCNRWKTRGRSLTGSALLWIFGLLPAATQPCRRRLAPRPAATHRIPYRIATKDLAGLPTHKLRMRLITKAPSEYLKESVNSDQKACGVYFQARKGVFSWERGAHIWHRTLLNRKPYCSSDEIKSRMQSLHTFNKRNWGGALFLQNLSLLHLY